VKVHVPFFFAEQTVTVISYQNMLENYILQLEQDMDRDFIFQQDGGTPAPPSRVYLLSQPDGFCLDWKCWNDSSATNIT